MKNGLQIACERIAEAKKKGASELDLSGLGISKLPSEIAQLRKLVKLVLSHNELNLIPNDLSKLQSLETLIADHNQIQNVSRGIRQLGNLKVLQLNNNKINGLPKELGALSRLEELDLSDNNLVNLPRALRMLSNLRFLNLNRNRLHRIQDSISELGKLEVCLLADNELSKLPSAIKDLQYLKRLNLNGNKLTVLPTVIGVLQKLESLHLDNNLLNALPSDIGKMNGLRSLHLANNVLASLPKEMRNLQNLNPNNGSAGQSKGLTLSGNRFNVPDEIFRQNPPQIINYLLDLQTSKKLKPLHEAKVIVIGSGSVGKTSLVKKLLFDEFSMHQAKTEGIKIDEWMVKRGNDNIKLHIWDFGGQEIMHATHKFFMTSRSVYLLVVNPRVEDQYGETELEYWLKLIRSYAPDAPVVIAINKCETHAIDLPKGGLMDKYKNISGFVETSCLKNIGIGRLQKALVNAVSRLEHIDDLLPLSYFDIKKQLEERNDDYIPYNAYEKLCLEVDPDFTPQSMETLVRLLHDLGVMLNFSDDRRLSETQVLNPEWVTEGVYRIITSERLINNKGKITVRDINRVLKAGDYPTQRERLYIMDIMHRFELCYLMPDERDTYLVPGAFPNDRPEKLTWEYPPDKLLRFQYHYDVMPNSIMWKFIVRVHDFIKKREYWRNGVVIVKGDCEAFIRADTQDCRLYIEIAGNGNRRELLSFVRAQFELIHARLSSIDVESKIPIDAKSTVVVDYDDLLYYEEIGEEFMPIRTLRTKVRVKKLLNGIEAENMRTKNREENRQLVGNSNRPASLMPDDGVMQSLTDNATDGKLSANQILLRAIPVVFVLAAIADASGITLIDVWANLKYILEEWFK